LSSISKAYLLFLIPAYYIKSKTSSKFSTFCLIIKPSPIVYSTPISESLFITKHPVIPDSKPHTIASQTRARYPNNVRISSTYAFGDHGYSKMILQDRWGYY